MRISLKQFWRFYDLYCLSRFKSAELAWQLSDYLFRSKPNIPSKRAGKPWSHPIAFVALRVGRYPFGTAIEGDIALYDVGANMCIAILQSVDRPHTLRYANLYAYDVQHYAVWLPLFTKEQVMTAAERFTGWQREAVEEVLRGGKLVGA